MWLAVSAWGNVPGGGNTGPDVTVTVNGGSVIVANGFVTATIDKDSGDITSLIYGGKELVATSGSKTKIYHDWTGTGWDASTGTSVGGAFETMFGCVFTTNVINADMVDLSFKRTYNPAVNTIPADIDLHWVLRRGNTGLYCYSVLEHQPAYPAVSLGSWRMVWWIGNNAGTNVCEKIYVDDVRHWQMPSPADYAAGLATGIAEVIKLTTGVRAGKYDCKYEYSANLWDLPCDGHASDVNKIGQWCVFGSHEFFNCGPTFADLNAAAGIIHVTFNGLHYNTPDFVIATNTYWGKCYGPFLLYCNTNAAGGDACWADAKAQAAAEESAWPYAWVTNALYPLAGQRGAVSGTFLMHDPLKSSVNSSNAWIGLADPTDPANAYTGWQFQGFNYEYWAHCDAAGQFTIPHVRPGKYTLYAFNDGAMKEFSTNNITVTAGATNDLGIFTWNIAHTGDFIAWEIGKPNRSASEFKHGSTDWFEPYNWLNFPGEFSNPLEFNIGASVESNDWNYAHCAWPGDWSAWKWRINFILPTVPASGNATMNFAWASADHARIDMYVNGESSMFTSFYPSMSDGNALIREGIHAKYGTDAVSIPVAKLHPGTNTITLVQGRVFTGSATEHVMYDYLNLELPGVPPLVSGYDLDWRGGTNNNAWDIGATANWNTNGSPKVFASGNRVFFDDYGNNSMPVNITTALAPGAVTVWANKSYEINGVGALTGSMALGKGGLGTLTLANTNTFGGSTTVSNGTLRVNGGLSSSVVTVKAGATVGGSGTLGAGLLVEAGGMVAPGNAAGTLNIANSMTESGGATNLFELSDDPAGVSGTNDELNILGDLNLSGANVIDVKALAGELGVGTYTLIKYAGSFNGSLANLKLVGVPGSLANPPGAITLVVSDKRFPTNVVWKGGLLANTWDTQITSNWLNGSVRDYFVTGDAVTFDDSGSTTPAVNLTGTLNPNSVIINATNDYTFAGSGSIGGNASLTKQNSGTLTIAMATNSYTGVTTINGGGLSVADVSDGGSPSAIGASSSDPTNLVIDGGTFRYTGISASVVRGATVGANGATFEVATSSSGLTMSGIFTGPGTLIKTGPGTFQPGAGSTYAGGTVISNGTFTATQISAVGSGTVWLAGGTFYIGATKPTNLISTLANSTISGGSGGGLAGVGKVTGANNININITTGVFDLIGDLSGFSGRLTFGSANGVRLNGTSGSSQATFDLGSGTVGMGLRNAPRSIALGALAGGSNTTLSGDNSSGNSVTYTIGGNDFDSVFHGRIIDGSYSSSSRTILTKTGTGTLTLAGTNSYTGATTINAGALLIDGDDSAATGAVTVNASGTLGGSGIIGGTTSVKGTLTPGNHGAGQLTFTGDLTCDTGSAMVIELDKANGTNDPVNVGGTLTCAGTLTVNNLGGQIVAGDSFKILNAASYAGSFNAINLPPLVNATWNTSNLTVAGTVSAIAGGSTATSLTWHGDGISNIWDVNQSANWLAQNGAQTVFTNALPTVFDDTGSNAIPVTLLTNVQPGTLMITASKDYIFTGPGSVAGAGSLIKAGSGTLTLMNSNTYSGNTSINAGTLKLLGMDGLVHRWSFNGTLADSVGGQTAAIVNLGGNNATLNANSVTLVGGARSTSGYVSLGANLLPNATSPVTIEIWATPNAIQNWSRIIDVGTSTSENLLMSWTQGTTLASDRVEWKDSVTSTADNTCQPYSLGTEFHIALVIEPGAGTNGTTRVTWYRAAAAGSTLGNARGSFDSANTLVNFLNANFWLGRSAYTSDNTASASYNEVRIWNRALSADELQTLQVSGPDAVFAATLPANTALNLNGSTAVFDNSSGHMQTVGSLSGVTGSEVKLSNGGLTAGSGNASTTFAGILNGTNSFVKVGTGSLVLSGDSPASGSCVLSNGALVVNGSFAGGVVAAGGMLEGNGSIGRDAIIRPGATVAPGVNAIGALTFGGNLTLAAGATNFMEISHSPLTNDALNVQGILSGGGTLAVLDQGSGILAAGDRFRLFNATAYNLAFATVDLPALPAGLAWDVSQLPSAGMISVAPINPPELGSVKVSGNALIFRGTGGVPAGDYYLVGTTNLATPFTNWTRLITNQFDARGDFNFTNQIDPDWPQGFYRLLLP